MTGQPACMPVATCRLRGAHTVCDHCRHRQGWTSNVHPPRYTAQASRPHTPALAMNNHRVPAPVQGVVGPSAAAFHFAEHFPNVTDHKALDQKAIDHLVQTHAPTFVDLVLLAQSRSAPLRPAPPSPYGRRCFDMWTRSIADGCVHTVSSQVRGRAGAAGRTRYDTAGRTLVCAQSVLHPEDEKDVQLQGHGAGHMQAR